MRFSNTVILKPGQLMGDSLLVQTSQQLAASVNTAPVLGTEDLRARRDTIFANKFLNLVSAPEGAHEVDDNPDSVALCLIDFNEATVSASTDSSSPVIEQIFNNTGESGKFRVFRNRLLFLVANKQELNVAINNAREYRAIQNILKSQHRLEDLSESQQKQLKQKEGEMDLAVRVSLTNAYRHLFDRLSCPFCDKIC